MASLVRPQHPFPHAWGFEPKIDSRPDSLHTSATARYGDWYKESNLLPWLPSPSILSYSTAPTKLLKSSTASRSTFSMPFSEHLLRRKTPSGTLTAAYDGTPSGPSPHMHTSKQVLTSSRAHSYARVDRHRSRLSSSHLEGSVAARESDRILTQELQLASNGLQNFAFSPSQDHAWDTASHYQSVGQTPQVDSVLHGSSFNHNSFGRQGNFYNPPSGFLPPVQAPFGPTASTDHSPFGPYWPNGNYVPYQPAASQDRSYLSGADRHFLAPQNIPQNSSHPNYRSHTIHDSSIKSSTLSKHVQSFPSYPDHPILHDAHLKSAPNNQTHTPFLPDNRQNPYHVPQTLALPSKQFTDSWLYKEHASSNGGESLRKSLIQNRTSASLRTILSPTPSSPPNQVLSWAHTVYSRFVAALQRQAHVAAQNQLRVSNKSEALAQSATIFPEPLQSNAERLVNHSDQHQSGRDMHDQYSAVDSESNIGLRGSRSSTTKVKAAYRSSNVQSVRHSSVTIDPNSYHPTPTTPHDNLQDLWSADFMLRASATKALDLLANICQDSSKRVEALLLGGCLAYVLGDFAKALDCHVEAISNLAATFLSLNRRHEAEAHWRLAVSLRPNYFEAAEHLVGLLCFDKRHTEAVGIIDHIQDSLSAGSAASMTCSSQTAHQRPRRYVNADSENGRMMALVHAKGNILYNMHDQHNAAQAFEEVVLIAAGQSEGGIDRLIEAIVDALTRGLPNVNGLEKLSAERMLLAPQKALQTAVRCFTDHGSMPGLTCLHNSRAKEAAVSVTSNSLLSLAKIFQDGMTSSTVQTNGSQPSRSVTDILALYYLSLSLQPSPSTANNVGILLASVQPSRGQSRAGNDFVSEKPPFPGVLQGGGIHLALLYYQYGLQLDSKHAHLYTNLGSLLKDIGQLSMAIPMYQKAVECDPNFDIALANLANAVKDQGNIADAIKHYQRAVQVNPGFAEAVCGLANALNSVCNWAGRGGITFRAGLFDRFHVDDEGGLVDSLVSARNKANGWVKRVIDIVDSQLIEGETWGSGAVKSLYESSQVSQLPKILGSSSPEEMLRTLHLFLKQSSGQQWEGARVVRFVERVIRLIGRTWYLDKYVKKAERPSSSYKRLQIPSSLTAPKAPTVLPFHTFTFPLTAQQIRLISQRNGLRVSTSTLRAPWLPTTVFPPPAPPTPELVVAYVSSDFNNHPLAHLMQSVFGMHDRKRVKAICYATTASDKSTHRQKIEREAPEFRDASNWSVETLVRQIVRDGVHILINLNGYTRGARNEVFAARPAPIQMSFMGFAGTLGAEWCDYLLADEISVPQSTLRPHRSNHSLEDLTQDTTNEGTGNDWVYAENVIFARDASFCCDHRQSAVGIKEPMITWEHEQKRRWKMRKDLFPEIPDDAVIFGNFNQLYKIDPTTFRTWLRVLDQVPNSYLWLLQFPADGATHLLRTANAWAGPSIASRIKFTDVAPKALHIARGCIVDLFLDTPECNAHTTAADCLWSGTPLLTCARYEWKMCSRIAAGILAGAVDRKTPEGAKAWSELVAGDMEEYEQRAVRLGRGLKYKLGKDGMNADGRLVELRELLWRGRWTCPLFDTQRWVSDLELAYEEAWRRWVDGRGGDIYLRDLV
ncbi:MAG: hypothetical protein M1828_006803 [Chrysothrix sp. TS-e1954]|nr:MAG: hypothetical protein M1828_006803 [Chrysothrix sp. TS-e1954]